MHISIGVYMYCIERKLSKSKTVAVRRLLVLCAP